MIDNFDSLIKQVASNLVPASISVSLTGLKGSSSAYMLARLRQKLSQPLLVITPDSESSEELCKEIRFLAGNDDSAMYFPAWGNSTFKTVSPHPDTTGERLNTLSKLLNKQAQLVVTPLSAIAQKLLPRKILGDFSQYLVAGEEVERDLLIVNLINLGYSHVPLVEDRGTFASRGGILDIFPPNLPTPVRIEFFGDFIDTIRTFDPVSQRSLNALFELILLPSREVILSEGILQEFTKRLKHRCDDIDIPTARRRELIELLQSAIYPQGIEYLQPLFHPELETLFDYAGPDAILALFDPSALTEATERFADNVAQGEKLAQTKDLISCNSADMFLTDLQLTKLINTHRRINFTFLELTGNSEPAISYRLTTEENNELKVNLSTDSEMVLRPLVERLNGWLADNQRIILACHKLSQAQRLYELLSHHGVPINISEHSFPRELTHRTQQVEILIGDISRGFKLADDRLVVITEEEIFGKRVKRRTFSASHRKQLLNTLSELKIGDYIVHIDFGVGIYRGLQHLKMDDAEGDFLLLEYSGADKLYLPVDRINLVQRYIGTKGLEPRLEKLGGVTWGKVKGKARKAVQEMAEELLKIYAERKIREGYAFTTPDDLFREFEAAFDFEETSDQLAAIEDVLQDMQDKKPMDRLICGDVGYGKTEVAMRGAFKSVMDGKQVAVLVPTTVLAQQHLETFRKRFKSYPVNIEMLSRFRSPKEQKSILKELTKGTVDIIIGTHRLLQKDISFKDLGLLIIDEEHRFGVVHKEKLKKYRAMVDILTLTATPIPRTLHMSLMGIRDLSIIDTPPVDRLAIKTFVSRFNDELIRETALRELRRGGQLFFVHNRVQSIGAMAEHLKRIIPEARIAIAHGQMEEKELERVMLSFMHGESNLLLCTTIIESGLDIPRANTLIVNRAENFGLAQLYQLRGRVGRSRLRAYAYFLIPGEGSIPADARERLKILQDLDELGAGFRIATHDLEIRGAGDLLGGRQSGNIAAIGFELYTELLEEAMCQVKGEEFVERIEPELKLHIPAFIPEAYIGNANQRLVIYKKLAQANCDADIQSMMEELVDRYGKLPLAAEYLLEVMRLRLHLKAHLILKIEFDGLRLLFSFHQKTPVSPDTIITLVGQHPKKYQFMPDYRLTIELADTSFEGILSEARKFLNLLD